MPIDLGKRQTIEEITNGRIKKAEGEEGGARPAGRARETRAMETTRGRATRTEERAVGRVGGARTTERSSPKSSTAARTNRETRGRAGGAREEAAAEQVTESTRGARLTKKELELEARKGIYR